MTNQANKGVWIAEISFLQANWPVSLVLAVVFAVTIGASSSGNRAVAQCAPRFGTLDLNQEPNNTFNGVAVIDDLPGDQLIGPGMVIGGVEGSAFDTIQILANGVLTINNTPCALWTGPNDYTGELIVGTGAVTIISDGRAFLGTLTTLSGGSLSFESPFVSTSDGGLELVSGRSIEGFGVINGEFRGFQGSSVIATGPLTIGLATGFFDHSGAFDVGSETVTLNYPDRAAFEGGDELTMSGGLLHADDGIFIGAAGTLRGFGTIEAGTSPSQRCVNTGTIVPESSFGFIFDTILENHGAVVDGTRVELTSNGGIMGNGTIAAKVFGSADSIISPSSLNAQSVTLTLGVIGSSDGFETLGTLDVSRHTVVLRDLDDAILGPLTTLGSSAASGTLQAANGILLDDVGDQLRGHGVVDAPVLALDGTAISVDADGSLELGDGSTSGFEARGSIFVNQSRLMLNDADEALLGLATTLTSGVLDACNGVRIDFADTIFGHGIIIGPVSGTNFPQGLDIANNPSGSVNIDFNLDLCADAAVYSQQTSQISGMVDLNGFTLTAPNGVHIGPFTLATFGRIEGRISSDVLSAIVANAQLTLGDSSRNDGVDLDGFLDIGSTTVTLEDANEATTANVNISGGTLNTTAGLLIPGTFGSFSGFGTVNGRFIADQGATIVAIGGPLTIGDNSRNDGVDINGDLTIDDSWLTLFDADRSKLGPTTTLTNGILEAQNGVLLKQGNLLLGTLGDQIFGYGMIIGDVTGNFIGLLPVLASPTGNFFLDQSFDFAAQTVRIYSQPFAALAGGTYTINGGTIIVPNGLSLINGGTLTGQGTVDGSLASSPGTQITLTGDLTAGDPTESSLVRLNGDIDVGIHTLTLTYAGLAGLGNTPAGNQITLAGGQIIAQNGVDLLGAALNGFGTIGGRVDGNQDSVITLTADLTLGDASAQTGFNYQGTLHVGGDTLTLLEQDGLVTLAMTTTIDNGTIEVASGATVPAGGSLSGPGTIMGVLTSFGSVSPGNSAGTISAAGYSQQSIGSLEIEIGGTAAGTQYDVISLSGFASLSGTLNVTLMTGFTPMVGHSFTIITGTTSVTGGFTTVNLPALPVGLLWDLVYTQAGVTLNVIDEAACPANLGFDNQQTYDSGLGENVRTADLDGDGILDLVVQTSGDIQILSGFGDGTFDDTNPIILSAGGTTRTSDIADFNEDGNLDIAIASELTGGTNVVRVFLGQGNGVFSSADYPLPSVTAFGQFGFGVVAADFDEDGITDLVIGGDTLLFFRGNGTNGDGDGTFAAAANAGIIDGRLWAPADFNNDGILDLAAAFSLPGDVEGFRILLGNGNDGHGIGTFTAQPDVITFGAVRTLIVGDINEDNNADIILSNNTVLVYLGSGDGTTGSAVAYGGELIAWGLALADFNQDGIADLASGNFGNQEVWVRLGQGAASVGDGTFGSAVTFAGGGQIFDVTAADLDGDDIPDLAAVKQSVFNVSVFLGSCSSQLSTALSVVAPNGGQRLLVGDEYDVQWSKGGGVIAVDVQLLRNGSGVFETIARNQTGTTFTWTVTPPVSSNAVLRVVDSVVTGRKATSAAPFRISRMPAIVEPGWRLTRCDTLDAPIATHVNPKDGLLYAVGNSLRRIEADGSSTILWSNNDNFGIAFHPDNGDIYVADIGTGEIFRTRFGQAGREVWVAGFHSGDDDPLGLAIAPSDYTGNVVNPGEGVVVDFGSGGPAEIWRWSPDSPEGETVLHVDDGTFINPIDVAISKDTIYVVDRGPSDAPGAIYVVGVGGVLTPLATSVPMEEPEGITIDPVTGDLLIVEPGRFGGSASVKRVNTTTGDVNDVIVGFDMSRGALCGIDISADGRSLFVTDGSADKVYTFTLGPDVLDDEWSLTRTVQFEDGSSAHYNPVDGLLYVGRASSFGGGGLFRVENDASVTPLWTDVSNIVGVVIDPDSGDIFTSDQQSFGNIFRTALGANTRELWVTGVTKPRGLAIAPNDYVGNVLTPGEALVVDTGNPFLGTLDDVWLFSPGAAGGETPIHVDDGTLVAGSDIAIDAASVYVVDSVGVIYELGATGTLSPVPTVEVIGATVGVTIDPLTEDLFVLDAGFSDGQARLVRVDPTTGDGEEMFVGFHLTNALRTGVDVSPDGSQIFVTDGTANKIYTFTRNIPCPDADLDDVCDADDICPSGDDNVDTDGDGVPDGCDVCPGGDDTLDGDGDGFPDRCDRFGDFNHDGLVDLVDYSSFANCVNGPSIMPTPTPATTVADCLASFDSDNDGDVDHSDIAEFQIVFKP